MSKVKLIKKKTVKKNRKILKVTKKQQVFDFFIKDFVKEINDED